MHRYHIGPVLSYHERSKLKGRYITATDHYSAVQAYWERYCKGIFPPIAPCTGYRVEALYCKGKGYDGVLSTEFYSFIEYKGG